MAHLGDRVAAYVDGQLPADESERADVHLHECDECCQAVIAQRALKRRMTSLGATPAPSSNLLSALSDPARLAAAAPPSRMQTILDHAVLRAIIAASSASAVLAGAAYVMGAPTQPVDTVSPPVESFVAQFSDAADPVRQSVRAAVGPSTDLALAVAPGHAVAEVGRDEPEALGLLRAALGSEVSVELLANHYDLSVVRRRDDRADVVVSSDGHRVARYVIDQSNAVRQVVRYSDLTADAAVGRGVRTVSTSRGISGPVRVATSVRSAGIAAPSADATETIDHSTMDNLTSVGWPCHDRLGGDLERTSANWVDLSGEKAIALTYSDGRSTLTVYEQRGALSRGSVEGFSEHKIAGERVWVRSGSPMVATWDSDGIVYTVVTDGSREHLRDAVTDLPSSAEPDGVLDRVRRGLARLSKWASPGDEPA